MLCPTCSAENSERRRFCSACGAALPYSCPHCAFLNEPADKFCGGCGRSLREPEPEPVATEAELRPAVVLFADLAGFTRLSAEHDSETMHAVLSAFFECADQAIARHGGSIDKHIGDAVMGVFGAPRAYGDDPLRALRAALEIRRLIPAIASPAGPLAVHLGLASGQVLASPTGSSLHRSYTVTGPAANLAARLHEAAGAGDILISDELHRQLRDALEAEPLGPLRLEGLPAPQLVWRVLGLRQAPEAPPLPLVGRQAEMQQLLALIESCRQRGRGQMLVLRGTAGIGKSRLAEALEERARALGFLCHRIHLLDFGGASGGAVLRPLLLELLGGEAAADAGTRRRLAEQALASGRLQPERRPLLYDLLGLLDLLPAEGRALHDAMPEARRREERRLLLADLLAAAAHARPRLLLVEDLHWAEEATLASLAAVGRATHGAPLLLAATVRPEGDPLAGPWRAMLAGVRITVIELAALDAEEATELAANFSHIGGRRLAACLERGEGNPLFLLQLLRHATEAAADDALDIPDSIRSLVLARLDRLPAEQRASLQAASVLGQRFERAALQSLLTPAPLPDLAELATRGLLLPAEEGLRFAHALIREAVYATIPKARRTHLHRAAAQWYRGRDLALSAQHLERAGDAGAARAYLEAASEAAAAFAYASAVTLAERGLALQADPEATAGLALLRADALLESGRVAEARRAFAEAAAAPGALAKVRARLGEAAALRLSDDYESAFALLAEAEPLAATAGLTRELARLHHLRGNLYFPLGRLTECRKAHELALAEARRSGAKEEEARALGGLGDAFYAIGRMASAQRSFDAAVALASTNGFGRIEVANRPMGAITRIFTGSLPEARSEAEAAAEAARTAGHQRAEIIAQHALALVCLEEDRPQESLPHVAAATRLTSQLGAARFQPENLLLSALARSRLGETAEALRLAREALALCRRDGFDYVGPYVLAGLARLTDEPQEREAALREAEALLAKGSLGHNHLFVRSLAIEIAAEAGATAEAERHALALADYTAAEPLPWSEIVAEAGRLLAARRAGKPAPQDSLVRLQDRARAGGYRYFARLLETR